MARLFVVLASLALASVLAQPRDRCPVTCSKSRSSGLLEVDHDPSSNHKKHRCYLDEESGECECECRESNSHSWIHQDLSPIHCSGSWGVYTPCTASCGQTCQNTEVYTVATASNEIGNSCPHTNGELRTGPSTTNGPTCAVHINCPPGQQYTGYDDVTVGTCTSCAGNTYSDAWTSVGETCKQHTKTCSQGERLAGASITSAGICAACDNLEYNNKKSHRDTSCVPHGQCGPGSEPSGLSSKIAAGSCSPCAPGSYSSHTNSYEMCQPHTTCSSTQALIGESATSPGSCMDKCHDYYTDPNDVPITKKDNIYLDRHNVQCPNHQTLGGMGMSDFRLATRWDYNPAKIQYRYRCCDVEDGATTTHWTGRNDNGHGNDNGKGRSTIYLDRHNLDCGDNKVIKGFKLHTHWSDWAKIEYEYQCVPHNTATCSRYTTPASDEGNSIIYLDRHHVDCPEASQPYLKQVKLFRPSEHQIAYEYHCCAEILHPP
jgi:hypothetical protein